MSKFLLLVIFLTLFKTLSHSQIPSDNLKLWLKADAGVIHTSNVVSQWNDQSGNNFNLSQSSSTSRPLLVSSINTLNNQPIIRFDGSNDFMSVDFAQSFDSPNTYFIVYNNTRTGTTAGGIFDGLVSGQKNSLFFGVQGGVSRITAQSSGASTLRYNKTQPYDFILNTIQFHGSNSILFENGISRISGAIDIQAVSGIQLGRLVGGSTIYLRGDIAEFIFYNRVLTTEERQQVEKYLMDKYAPPPNLGADINDSYGFEDITLSTPGYYTNYSWSTGATTSTINVNNPGQYILTTTDIFGRVLRDTINVTRPDYASIQLSNQLICYNGNTSVTAPLPVGDYQFVQWSDGVTSQTRTISQTSTLSYTVKDNANFTRTSNSATFTFDNSLQNVRLGNDTTLCQGNSIQLVQTSPTISSYLWSTGATTNSIPINTSGEYTLTVTNSIGCIKKDTIQVTIQGQSPTISLNFPTQFCQNESAAFSETSFVQSGEAIGSRLWSFGNSTSSSLSSGTFSNSNVGTYNGTLTVTSVGGCQSSQAFSYTVRPKPIASYTAPLLCDNVNALFINTSSAPLSSIATSQWFVNDVLNASTTNLNYAHPATGNYNLKLVVTNGFGCRDTSSQNQSVINTYPIPSAPSLIDPFNTKTVLSTEQIPFSWSAVANNYFYELQFSVSSDFSSLLSNQNTTQTGLTSVLNTGGTVFWRVKANNPCLLGGTSQIFSLQSVAIADSLRLWLRADRGVSLNGSTVSAWADQSSNNLNASQSTAANQPTFVSSNPTLNGLSSLRFDGTNDLLNGGLIPRFGNNSLSVFAVTSGGNQNTTNAVMLSSGTVTTGWWLTRRASAGRLGVLNNNNTLQGTTTTLPISGYNFRLFGYNKVFGTSALLKVNGNSEISSTTAAAINGFTNANYQIGAGSGANFLNGDIAELMVFTKSLSTDEQAGIEKYLMDKYTKPVNIGPDITSNYGFCDFTLTSNAFFQSYLWSTGATTSSISINEPGIYWLEATDIFGRITRDTMVLSRPYYAQIQMNNQLICYNDPQTIQASIPVGDYQFVQWNDGITTPARIQGQAQSLFYTLKDNQNCTKSSNTAIITIDNSLQAVRLGNDTSLCVGNTIQLAVSSPIISSYAWNTGVTNASQIVDTTGAYVLTVSNTNGCFKSDTINITILGNAPVLAFTVPSSVCLGSPLSYSESSTVLGANISTILWDFGNSLTSTQNSGIFTYGQVGEFTGSLLVQSDNGCSSSASFPVSVKSLPIANFTVPLLCSNTPATFTNTSTIALNGGTISSQFWNIDNLQVATTNNLIYTFPNSGTYEVELIVENQFGCRDTSIQQVNTESAFTIPTSSSLISPSNDFVTIVNQPISFVWNTVANNYFYSVEVSTNQNFSTIDFTTTTPSPNLSFTPFSVGTYYWRVKTNNACLQGVYSSTRTFNVINIQNDAKLWVNAGIGVVQTSGAVSQWNDQSGNGFNLSQATSTARPTFINSVTTLNNQPVVRFDGSDFISVDFGQTFQSPNTYFLIHNNIRTNTSASGIFDGLIDGARNTFLWGVQSGIGRMITTTSSSIIYNKNQPYNYCLNTIDFNGASSNVFENGTIRASGNLPDGPLTGIQLGRRTGSATNFLQGDIAEFIYFNRTLSSVEQTQVQKYLMDKYAPPVTLGEDITSNYGFCNITITATGYFTNYLWSNAATTASIQANEPGYYWVQATDIFGRISSDTILISRPHYSEIQLNNQLICYNDPQTINATLPVGDYTFVQWNDGITTPSRVQGQAQSLFYTVRDNQNCTKSSNTAIITIDNSLQAIRLGDDTSLCVGNSIQLAITSPAITAYSWNTGNTNPIQLIDTTGAYILTVSNANGCLKRDTVNVTVLGNAPVVAITVPSIVCIGNSLSYSESSTVSGSNISSVFWNFGNSQTSTQNSGLFTYGQVGEYTGSLLVQSDNGCSSSASFPVSVKPLPIANFTVPLLCSNTSATFTNTSTIALNGGTINSQFWSIDNSQVATTNNLVYSFTAAGTYEVGLMIEDQFGCRDTLIQQVNTESAFTIPTSSSLISPSNDFTTLINQPISFVWNAVANNYFYSVEVSTNQNFSTIDFTTTSTLPNLNFTPTASGIYFWRVKTNNACLQGGYSSTRSLYVIVIQNDAKLWVNAGSGVVQTSGAVSQWNDQSGNGFHLTQATSTARPTLINSVSTLNNQPVLRFDGSDFISVDYGQTFQFPNTYFIIHNNTRNNTSASGIFDGLVDGAKNTFLWSVQSGIGRMITQTSSTILYSKNQPYNYCLNKIEFNGASSNVFENGLIRVNGNLPEQAISGIQLGRRTGSATNFLQGDIAEFIYFNRTLSSTEQQQVEKYLMDKYAPPVSLGADITSTYGFCDTVLIPKGYFTNYLWSTGESTSTLAVNQPGTYWVRATDIFGRISSDTLRLIRPVYDSIALQNRIVCFNNLVNETAFVPSGYTFVSWSDGILNQTRLLNQNQNLSYTVADNRSCQLTSNLISVVIDSSLFAISLGVDTNLCVGNSIELQQSSSSITSYLWNTGNTSSTQILDTTGLYILQVQNLNNCFNRDSIFVTIIGNAPIINYNFPLSNCQFNEIQFSESSTVQGSTIASTSWTIGNQTPILNSIGQITFNQPGIVPVRLEIVSAQNCRSIDTFSIIVHPKPIVNFTTINYCPYQNIEFNPLNLVASQLVSYNWNFGQTSSNLNTSQLANPSHFYGQEGTYSVNLKVVDEYGCKDTLIQEVLIQPAPISSFSFQNTCENTFVEFTNTSSILSGYSITSNIWSYGDNTSAINPTVGKGYANFGDYAIELIVVGNNGCSDTSSNSISIYPNPVLNWSITPSCKNTLTVFEDLSSIPEGTLVSTDWLVNLQYPLTTPVASYRFATLGAQYLNLTSTSDKNCTSDTLIIVNVNPELNANFNYSPANIVAGVPVTFTDLSIGSSTATWDLGIGEELVTYTPSINQFAKTYPLEWVDSIVNVTLFVENEIGCKDTVTKTFGVQGPAFDLEVKSIFIQEINSYNTIGVEFENKGTIEINKIDFQLSSLNSIPIQETWTGNLLANQNLIYMFNAKLSAYNSTQDDLTNFICVEGFASDNSGNVDVIIANNKVCQNTENESLALISVAPNPTESITNVSLLIPSASESSKLNVSLYNMNGEIVQYVIDNQVVEQGVFDFNVDFSNLSRGIYLLKIEDGTSSKVIRLSKI